MPRLPAKIKILSILAKALEKQKLNFSRSELFRMETRISLKYFVNGCSMLNLLLIKMLIMNFDIILVLFEKPAKV